MYEGQYVLSVWNFIVEQGDSFITTVTTAQCLKYEVRSFLLVEIILSNAYKKKVCYMNKVRICISCIEDVLTSLFLK